MDNYFISKKMSSFSIQFVTRIVFKNQIVPVSETVLPVNGSKKVYNLIIIYIKP